MTAKSSTKQLRLLREKISELTQDKRKKMLHKEEARIRRERETVVRPEYQGLVLGALVAAARGTNVSGLVEGLVGVNPPEEADPEPNPES
jgi:hypothetical protein